MPQNILTLLGMLVAVAAVLVLAWATTRWIAKRGMGGRFAAGPGSGRFHVLRQLNLGQGERLVLVRLGERCLLLGVTQRRISLLHELSETEAEEWLSETEGESAAPPSFWEALQKNLSRRK